MAAAALDRARAIALGVLSASAVATGVVGVHLARDHADQLSTQLVDNPSGSQNVSPQTGLGDNGPGDDQGQLSQPGQPNGGLGGTDGSNGSNGSNGFGQLAPLFGGSGQPQARSRGS